ncbi:hypothetical protein L208DRAFT_1374171 [Tricholoma matsutake]|nr:hypothetical protein L208DRAFT_1374171 [Tricholoma matsutake 945]
MYLQWYPEHPSLKNWVQRIADAAGKKGNHDLGLGVHNIAPNLGVEKAPVKARNKRKIDEVDDDSIASDLSKHPGMMVFKDLRVVPKKQEKTAGHPGDETLRKLTMKYTHKDTGYSGINVLGCKARACCNGFIHSMSSVTTPSDAGSMKSKAWTPHATPSKFELDFTAAGNKTVQEKTVKSVGEDQFSMMCSDSMGNTKRGCKDAQEVLVTILDLGNCCHHLQNMAGDIKNLKLSCLN